MVTAQRADAKPKASNQPVLIVDLDGCLVANPPGSVKESSTDASRTITDVNYWTDHWANPMGAEPNYELIRMVRTLVISGWKAIVLTARPESFRFHTEQYLRRIELECSLIMRNGSEIIPSDEWKANVIAHMLVLGYDVQLAVEDYKPNADAIRHIVPVLLYERKRDKK